MASREVIDESNYDFNLVVNPGPRIGIVISYNEAALDGDFVERIAGHIDALAGEVIRDAGQQVGAIDILPPAERRRVLIEFNRTDATAAPQATLKQLFEQQAARTPHAVAAVCGGRRLHYRDLDRRANQMARFLIARGAAPGTLVGVVADKSLEALVAILAVQKLGGVYVPICSGWPARRVAEVIAQTQLPMLLHTGAAPWPGGADASNVRCWSLDALLADGEVCGDHDHRHRIDRLSAECLPETRGPQDVCYLMFTSGTTGKPKGIANTQANFAHLAHDVGRHHYAPGKGVIQVAAWHFDASVMDLFGGLVNGATVYLTDASPRNIIALLTAQPTHELLISPSILREIVATMSDDDARRIQALEQVTCGGEPLDYQLVRRACDVLGSRVWFTNIYGPTETTVFCTRQPVTDLASTKQVVEIGRPIGEMKAYVLDERLNPCPIGIVGEICIAGPGVAQGYFNDADLTRSAFVAAPFEPGRVLYRTGDRACWNDRGVLEIAGRTDSQAKIRGYRVELGEVRSALLQHPGIDEAAVLTKDAAAGRVLVAFVVLKSDRRGELGTDEMRRFLLGLLPDYMIPASIVELDAMPCTANHKVDLDSLRNRLLAMPSPARQVVMPATPTERRLAALFRQVLGGVDVHADDNFFELGGNSLKAIEIVSQIKAELGLPAEMSNLYVYPTLKDLATYYDELALATKPSAAQALSLEQCERVLAQALQSWIERDGGAAAFRILREQREDGSLLLGAAVWGDSGAVDADTLFAHLRLHVCSDALPHYVTVTRSRALFDAGDFWSLFAGHADDDDIRSRTATARQSFLAGVVLQHPARTYRRARGSNWCSSGMAGCTCRRTTPI